MKYRFKSLSKEKRIELDNARKISFYVSYHSLKRNKVFIDKEYIREVAKSGKILSYEKSEKGEILVIGNRKDDIIEGKQATLIVVVSLTMENVMTCYYRTRYEKIYNFCKKEI